MGVCVCGNGCHLLCLNLDKPTTIVLPQGAVCALWPGPGKTSKDSAVHAVPRWMSCLEKQDVGSKPG